MVLLLDIIRRFSPKGASQWIHNLTQKVVNRSLSEVVQKVDDDLRSISALSVERVGHADNLSTAVIIPRGQVWKAIYEGGQGDVALWLYGNDVSNPEWKDYSGWDGYIEKTAVLFDGTDDRLDCGNDATLWSTGLTKFSFSIWVYPTSAWDGQFRAIIVHGSGAAHGFELYIETPTVGDTRFFIRNNVGSLFQATSTALVLNKWNNIIGTYDSTLGSANIKLFIDKVQGAGTGNLAQVINNSSNLFISNNASDLKGRAKDFRFWKTIALDATQRDQVWGNSPTAPAPDYWLKMDEGTGNPVDFISKTKTATLQNGTTWAAPVDRTKNITRIGYPCVVKTTQPFIGRKLVGYFNGIADGGKILDHEDLRVQTNTTGITISGWFYIANASLLNGNFRIIYVKKDDASNHVILFIDPTSNKIVFELNKGGSVIKKEVANMFALNTWFYGVWVWDFPTNALTVYKAAVSQTVNNWAGSSPTLPADTNGYLMHNNTVTPSGFANNAFYNLKFWKNRKLTQAEVTNENTNKFTISNLQTFELPIAGFMSIGISKSYTLTSYTLTSYTAE